MVDVSAECKLSEDMLWSFLLADSKIEQDEMKNAVITGIKNRIVFILTRTPFD